MTLEAVISIAQVMSTIMLVIAMIAITKALAKTSEETVELVEHQMEFYKNQMEAAEKWKEIMATLDDLHKEIMTGKKPDLVDVRDFLSVNPGYLKGPGS